MSLDQPAEPTTADASAIGTMPASPGPAIPPDDPRTGEPRRPWAVWTATAGFWLTVALSGASVLTCYWFAVSDFANASWLMGRFVTTPGSLERVLLAVAVTVIALVAAVPSAIVGYYAWTGYRWSRIGGLIAAALSFGLLTLNPIGWAAIGTAVLGAGLLWLPAAGRFFTAWQARRHAPAELAAPILAVEYGPLPRYR